MYSSSTNFEIGSSSISNIHNILNDVNDFKLESNGHQNGNGTLDSEGGVVTEESIQRTIDSLEVFFNFKKFPDFFFLNDNFPLG